MNILYTVDREIFVIKKCLWVAPSTKIKCTNFFATNYHVYDMFFVHVHFACNCFSILDAYSSISAAQSSVALFLNLTMPVTPMS